MAKICMIAYTFYPFDSRVRREAEALAERGDSVDVICLGNKDETDDETLNHVHLIKVKIGRYRGSSRFSYLVSYLQFFAIVLVKLVRLQVKNGYQVIQVHTMPDFMVFTALYPKLRGVKVLLDVHDLMPELYMSKFGFSCNHPVIRLIEMIERRSIAFANKAIAVHTLHLSALCSHGNPSEKFTVLPNLPDSKFFPVNFCQEHNGHTNNHLELMYHGTVARRNGLEIAIRAISTLKDDLPGLSMHIIGDGDEIHCLAELVEELGLQDIVKIEIGMKPMENLAPLIAQADVGIVPILYDSFTRYMLPVKLLEYVAMGLPVICSRTETIEAYFNDSMVQFTRAGDVPEFAQAIRLLYENSDRRKELSLNANQFNQKYNWQKQKQVYYQLVDSLIKS